MRVLLAEDHRPTHRLLLATLRGGGHEVVSAHDGVEALACLRTLDGPCLALLDWNMPGISGVEVCRQFRRDGAARYRYLMLLTSNTDACQAAEGLLAGADDFLRKPIAGVELNARMRAGERILILEQELVAAREEMRREASYDKLTGLLNRGAVVALLEREVACARRSGAPLAVALLDLDFFKRINDSHGHDRGDHVLRETADRVRAAVRQGDLVGRYGGEEFLVVLPGCDPAAASATAERIRAAVAEVGFTFQGSELSVTTSIGVAALQPEHTSCSLVSAADQALYRAKKLGRDRVEWGGESGIPVSLATPDRVWTGGRSPCVPAT